MASTIQLKTGTGSAVPSSLTQGEVAINIDNGLVYYGSGSTNTTKQLESFTNITASGNISSSGTITAEHIVSSDDIVASGELFTNGTGLNKIAGILTLGSSAIPTGGNNLKVTGTSTFTSHITSSGNISSSGIVTGVRLAQGSTLINDAFAPITGHANIVTVGALNAGSITSGFTSIDVGSGAITTTGTATLGTIANVNTTNVTASGNIEATSYISASEFRTTGHITASGNISASGTIITEDLQVDTITNQTTGGGIILDSAGFIGLDSAGGDIRFRDAGANQLHFDMDGTDGAQVISPSVAGDDIIFKNQGGDSVLTLKSEGQTEIHGNITASGNISASGKVYSYNEQYWSTTARLTVDDNTTNYFGPNPQGTNYYFWNRDLGTSSTTITSKTTTLNSGFKLPYKAILTGYHLNIQGRNTTDNISFTLVYSDGLFGGDVTSTSQTLVEAEGAQTVTITTQNNFYELDRRDQFSIPVSAMTMLYPRFKKTVATGGVGYDFQLAVQYRIIK